MHEFNILGKKSAAADRFDQTAAEADKIRMTLEMALEEVICDAAQRMLLDTDAGKKLAQWGAQSQQNKGFLEKVKSIIQDILNRLRSALKGVDPDSLAAQEFSKMEANAKKILADMFEDMSIDAGEKLSTIKAAGMLGKLNKNTAQQDGKKYKIVVDVAKAEDGRHIMYATKGKINRVGTVQVNSLKSRGSGQNSNSNGRIAQTDLEVKRKVLEYQYAIKNVYTNREIQLGSNGLDHSLDGDDKYRLRTNARLSAVGGEIVQNAIPVNGLKKENQQANGTYAMACLVFDGYNYVLLL